MDKKVFIRRMEQFKLLMAKNSLDYCIATPGTNFYYITGIDTFRMERFIGVILPAEGEPFIVCPSFEEERLRKETFINDFYPWKEEENPCEILGKIIKGKGKKHGTTGLEPTTHFETYVKLKEYMTGIEFRDGGFLFSAMRRKKIEEEIKALKKAVDITEENIDYSLKHLKTGMKEYELKKYITGDEKLVQFGETSSYPHSEGGENTLQKDNVVLIDKGDMWEKY
ncbi:MAG: aminopeptidase P family N-terminal domain-containing protein, partial [Candidatus Eremiobacterota bacterium]